jgi:hypothetical protein
VASECEVIGQHLSGRWKKHRKRESVLEKWTDYRRRHARERCCPAVKIGERGTADCDDQESDDVREGPNAVGFHNERLEEDHTRLQQTIWLTLESAQVSVDGMALEITNSERNVWGKCPSSGMFDEPEVER